MKKSKRVLLEMSGVSLPVVKKQLKLTEETSVPFSSLDSGDVIMIPDKYGSKKFIIVKVSKFGGYLHVTELKELKQIKSDELQGAKVAKEGIGSWRIIEG